MQGLAAITEMIHTASLVHDDVLDAAETRRGGKAVHKEFSTKAAVRQMTNQLAAELGPEGIRVNAVAPGCIETPMTWKNVHENPLYQRNFIANAPLRRYGWRARGAASSGSAGPLGCAHCLA